MQLSHLKWKIQLILECSELYIPLCVWVDMYKTETHNCVCLSALACPPNFCVLTSLMCHVYILLKVAPLPTVVLIPCPYVHRSR